MKIYYRIERVSILYTLIVIALPLKIYYRIERITFSLFLITPAALTKIYYRIESSIFGGGLLNIIIVGRSTIELKVISR